MRTSLHVCLILAGVVVLLATCFCWKTHRDMIAMLRSMEISD